MLLAVAMVASTALLPAPAHAGQVVDFPDQDNGVVSVGHGLARSGVLLAQTFTSGATANLTKVQLDLRRGTTALAFGSTVTRLDILATDPGTGAPTGSTLGFTTVTAATVSDANPCAMVSFTGLAVPLTVGTTYALVVSTDGADEDHSVRWCHSGDAPGSASNAYADGSAWSNTSGTWQAADPAVDRRFSTFVSFTNAVPACNDVGPVSTAANTAVAIPFSCTDADAWQQLTYHRSTQPGHGTVSPASGGTLVYTPQPGYAGPDSFTYRARDGYEFSGVRTVTLDVGAAAQPPPAAPPTVSVAGKPDVDSVKGTARLTVAVSGPGTVTISGKGLKTATATASQAGQVTLTVKPDAKTKKKLKDKHKATVTVTVAVTPAGSTTPSSTVLQKVKLKKKVVNGGAAAARPRG